MNTDLQPGSRSNILTVWRKLSGSEKLGLILALLTAITPFLPWFHLCITTPGNYSCQRWNGFQRDNDVYGTIIFIVSLLLLARLTLPYFKPTIKLPLARQKAYLTAGLIVTGTGLLRLLTFQGKSSDAIVIGPSTGMLLIIICGLATILLINDAGIAQSLLAAIERVTKNKKDKPTEEYSETIIIADDDLAEQLTDKLADPDERQADSLFPRPSTAVQTDQTNNAEEEDDDPAEEDEPEQKPPQQEMILI